MIISNFTLDEFAELAVRVVFVANTITVTQGIWLFFACKSLCQLMVTAVASGLWKLFVFGQDNAVKKCSSKSASAPQLSRTDLGGWRVRPLGSWSASSFLHVKGRTMYSAALIQTDSKPSCVTDLDPAHL
jgi:hypothetical protein